MDEGRHHDLARLQAVIDNPSKSYAVRRYAWRTQQSILEQLKDKKLTELRVRLIRAAKAGDLEWEWKIGNEIKRYRHQAGYDQ